jgi:hypothetical protein
MTDLKQMLDQVSRSAAPADVLRDLVLQNDGFWSVPTEISGLFEVQLAGLVGLGPSPAAAADDWIVQARARVLKPPQILL